MKLHGRIEPYPGERVIARLADNPGLPPVARATEALLLSSWDSSLDTSGFAAVLLRPSGSAGDAPAIVLPEALGYLTPGDIVAISPEEGHVGVLYRRVSRHNSMLITERCNSFCVMCSQPPRSIDDHHHVDDILRAIALMSPETVELGITGGEPTLYFEGLLRIIRAARDHLPDTALHVLSNGRLFSYLRYAQEVARARHPDLVFGVPLYSSVPSTHDHVVQARGAFNQTVRGMMNLARVEQSVELRVVIHSLTWRELPELARFITRNLPFVRQVALMGLEIMGFTRAHLDAVWVDPTEYQDELEDAVGELHSAGIATFIYNHQLCLLRRSLWPFAVKSISDWKNAYAPECDGCAARDQCGGFFASAKYRRSSNIHPLVSRDIDAARSEHELLPVI